jgi:hypothetical protein
MMPAGVPSAADVWSIAPKALTFLQNSAPIVSMRSLERTSHVVEYQHCTRCGATIIPIPHETLIRLYHSEEAAKKATEVHNLCENAAIDCTVRF